MRNYDPNQNKTIMDNNKNTYNKISTTDIEKTIDDLKFSNKHIGETGSIINPQKITSGSHDRILWYNSFEERDAALMNISSSRIRYIFDSVPAVTVIDMDRTSIPINGLKSVIDSRPVYVKASSSDEVLQLYKVINGYNTLSMTRDLTGISAISKLYNLTGKGVKVAVIDSGIGNNLDAFKDENGNSRVEYQVVSGLNETGKYDLDGHGTHVAGILAGNGIYNIEGKIRQTDNVGMAPDASILSIRVLNQYGYGDNSWIIEGIDRAIKSDARVLTLSLSTNLYTGEKDLIHDIIRKAYDAGKIIVGAAGNNGPYGASLGSPGGFDEVINVGAAAIVQNKGIFIKMWSKSSVGPAIDNYPGPDLVAPGTSILSVDYRDGTLHALTGTSMATPHISGGIALLLQAFPNATETQIRYALLASCVDIGYPVETQGRGFVNFYKAYNILADTIKNNTNSYINVNPMRFSDNNYFYHTRISNWARTFEVFMLSAATETIYPHVAFASGVKFDLPDNITLNPGNNAFNITITVNSTSISYNQGQIYFTNSTGSIFQYANITYSSVTRFPQAKILFDTSHDRDTPSGYFASHGPRGQFSQMAKILEERGYRVDEHKEGNLTSQILSQYDILIIIDPDIDFSQIEIDSIQKFMYTDGKSVLIAASGGFFTAEEYDFIDSDINTINDIITGSGIQVSNDYTYDCNTDGYYNRSIKCVKDAITGNNQDIFQKNMKFANYGPVLSEGKSLFSDNVYTVASQNDQPVIMASELKSGGRLLVMSSQLFMDNVGTSTDYIGSGTASNNRQMIRDMMDWLAEPRSVKARYVIDGVEISEHSTELLLHERHIIEVYFYSSNNTLLNLGDNITLFVLQDDLSYSYAYNITLIKTEQGSYAIALNFGTYGYYDFYVPVSNNGDSPTDAYLSIFAVLNQYNDQDTWAQIANIVLILIAISWILWVKNEGGRKRKKINI